MPCDTRDRLAYPELMAMVLLIGLLGFLLDAAARGAVSALEPLVAAATGRVRDSGHSLYRPHEPP